MKSRTTLASIASVLVVSSLVVAACSDNSGSTLIGNTGGTSSGGSSTSAGGSSAGKSQAGTSSGGTSQAGTSGGGTSGGSGGSAIDCSDPTELGQTMTLVELNKALAPLPTDRVHVTGVVATSHKLLVSPSKSGCLWGVYVTTAGTDIAEYGSMLVTVKGKTPVTDANSKLVCSNNEQDSVIPGDVKPGDVLDLSGYIDEFLQTSCGKDSTTSPGTKNPMPDAGQRQITSASCVTKNGTAAVPTPHEFNDVSLLDDITTGKNTDDVFHKWGNAPINITASLTAKVEATSTEKYYNCSAVSGFGNLYFNETSLTVDNGIIYDDVTCAGPHDSAKGYDFPQPTTFTSIVGILDVNFCTWQVSIAERCGSFQPSSPTCDKLTDDQCAKVTGATACAGGPENTADLCSDKIDNDGNGFIDCADKNCCAAVDCKTVDPTSYCATKGAGGAGGAGGGTGENTAALCADKMDNDGDGFIDCNDKECCSVVACTDPATYCGKKGAGGAGGAGGGTGENTAALCADKMDNDGDGFIDCNDKECCALVTCTDPATYCGKKGSGGSGGSSSGSENTAALCSDKIDNDGDKFIDCNDKDCCSVVTCTDTSTYCGKQGKGGAAGSN